MQDPEDPAVVVVPVLRNLDTWTSFKAPPKLATIFKCLYKIHQHVDVLKMNEDVDLDLFVYKDLWVALQEFMTHLSKLGSWITVLLQPILDTLSETCTRVDNGMDTYSMLDALVDAEATRDITKTLAENGGLLFTFKTLNVLSTMLTHVFGVLCGDESMGQEGGEEEEGEKKDNGTTTTDPADNLFATIPEISDAVMFAYETYMYEYDKETVGIVKAAAGWTALRGLVIVLHSTEVFAQELEIDPAEGLKILTTLHDYFKSYAEASDGLVSVLELA